MSTTTPRFRIIDNRQGEAPLAEDASTGLPCWSEGCTLYWDDLPDRVRLQHGENPEAVQDFRTTGRDPWGGWTISRSELYAWLAAIHAYEVPADASPRGRGAE